ncbi:profilin [Clavulina sp. PMI_390]|nr:profilin [Clavulina sp. PMI_390]
MSTTDYVNTHLVGTGKVSQAAILGQAGGVWAASPGFNLAPAEQTRIINAWNNPDDTQASGITVAGVKYFTLQVIPNRSVYGKKGADGLVIVKTKQAVLVAVYKPPTQQTECTPVVESLADYLIMQNN